MKPHTDSTAIRLDRRRLTVEVTAEFYDKMIDILILANYISEHNKSEAAG